MNPKETKDLPYLKPLQEDSHKGTQGHVLIAAGSQFMPGAAVLAARAAYRCGAGLVTVLTDTSLVGVIATGVPEAIFTDWSAIGEKFALGEPLEYDSVLIGPGLGTRDRGRLVFDLIKNTTVPKVLDADALNLLADATDQTMLSPCENTLWTPHPGEFKRLTGINPCSNDEKSRDKERIEASRQFVQDRGGVLVLKGHRTIVMDGERYAINTTGNPGMATAGTGDVLAGCMVALLGKGEYSPFEAARLAVHLHGLSGDLGAENLGEVSLKSGDLVDFLPAAIQSHSSSKIKDTKKKTDLAT